MHKTYNELTIYPSLARENIVDFIFSLGFDAIEEREDFIIVRSEDDLKMLIFALEQYAEKLSTILKQDIELKTSLEIKKSEDWIKKYQNSIKPISVGDFYIRPDWQSADDTKRDIIINPALAFGSGHHESTHGCILQLQNYLQRDDTLLDVGCGSGILGIVSAKLGAIVDICDTDELAVQSARDNFKLNGVKFNSSWVGSVGETNKEYSVVVANIIADILIMLNKDLKKSVKSGGYLILSGILDKYEERVEERFSDLLLIKKYKKNEWFTLVFKRQ